MQDRRTCSMILRVWSAQAQLHSWQIGAEQAMSKLSHEHGTKMARLRDRSAESIDLMDLEREEQLQRLVKSQQLQNQEMLLVFGIHTLFNIIDAALYRARYAMFCHWYSLVSMKGYTAKITEVSLRPVPPH